MTSVFKVSLITRVWLLALFFQLVILSKGQVKIIDEECSGHGQRNPDGVCVCADSWPQSGGSGWTGELCQVVVYAGQANGEDMTSSCSADHGCNTLKDGDWACFAVPSRNASNWNYVAMLLNKTGNGDPDVYMFSKNESTPNFTSGSGFFFEDTTIARSSTFRRTLAKSDFPHGTFDDGFYTCIHAYPGSGDVAFSLFLAQDPCPNGFAENGVPLMCSTPKNAEESQIRFSQCTGEGRCVCKSPYAPPGPSFYKGLGFEDCSAEVVVVADDQIALEHPFVAADEHVAAQTWRFYGFNVTSGQQILLNVAEIVGRVELFAKLGQPPGNSPGQFDIRADWNPAPDARQHEIIFDEVTETRVGVWWVGVLGGRSDSSYEISIQRNNCPRNCSSNGNCDPASHTCTCTSGYGGRDCSIFSSSLQYNSSFERNDSSVFEYEYFTVEALSDAALKGNVEVTISATCSSNQWNPHIAARPELLLWLDPSQPDVYPTETNHTHRLVLDLDRPHSLVLCPSQLINGNWKASIHSPLPNMPLNYTLTIDKVGRCLNNCSGHGACDGDGICQCSNGRLGGDCSVDTAKANHPWRHLLYSIFLMAVGAAFALAYVSFYGMPAWVPIRRGTFHFPGSGIGLYQELSEHEGI